MVDACILGYEMHICGQRFDGVDGIVFQDVEESIGHAGSAEGNFLMMTGFD